MLKISSFLASLFFVTACGIALANGTGAVEAREAARPANAGVSRRCIVNAEFYGTPIYFQLEFKEEARKLTGKIGEDKLGRVWR